MAPFVPFPKVSWKIVTLFIDHPSSQLSFSDVVRLSSAGPTNAQKALATLQAEGLLNLHKERNRTLYQLELRNFLVHSLLILRGWQRVNQFPPHSRRGITTIIQKLAASGVTAIYLFGSALRSSRPQDIDLGIIYQHDQEKVKQIWLQTIRDFGENIEAHFFPEEEFIAAVGEGDYALTSTLWPCLVLYDRYFLYEYLGKILLPSKKVLLRRIQELEEKITLAYQLYRQKKQETADIVQAQFDNFLRLYIASQQQIPGPKHDLPSQAKGLGLQFKKRKLWDTLEWMSSTIRQIKTTI
ncbi:MAG: hypothetical protein AABX13_05230 [Nanoarchaeota archaeon]